ncbi:MAG: WG repeat-containing protein [Treponema sp.]|nr:WG repeat-containing protein [Treponema sp.]
MKIKSYLLILTLLTCQFFAFSEGYSLFMKDGKYGIISNEKNIKVQPLYNWISINSEMIICSRNRKIEIYDTSLNLKYSPEMWININGYDKNKIFLTESMSGKKTMLDVQTGKIEDYIPVYSEEHGFSDDVQLVIEKNKSVPFYSIVDRKGNVLLTDIEQAHSVFSDGMLAVIMKDGKSGFVNTKGKFVFEADFYIDPEDLGPRKYPSIFYGFSEGKAVVKNNEKKWVQYDIKGKKKYLPENIIPVSSYYENGLLLVRDIETQKMGYMNQKFKMVIPCKFEGAQKFVGKYAAVIYEGKDAIIDSKGEIVFCEELK